MSNDVERLAGIITDLGEEDALIGRVLARRIARRLLDEGVTLPTPPRATPLEAAARASVEPDHRWELLSETGRATVLREMRRAITAAVGALSDETLGDILSSVTSDYTLDELPALTKNLRAALLARLTEGGTA